MTTTNAAFEALRHEFERWARSENWLIPRNSFGEYVYATTRDGWDAYQAATERAAILCEVEAGRASFVNNHGAMLATENCAAAIRAGGEQT